MCSDYTWLSELLPMHRILIKYECAFSHPARVLDHFDIFLAKFVRVKFEETLGNLWERSEFWFFIDIFLSILIFKETLKHTTFQSQFVSDIQYAYTVEAINVQPTKWFQSHNQQTSTSHRWKWRVMTIGHTLWHLIVLKTNVFRISQANLITHRGRAQTINITSPALQRICVIF